jgi:hypothetical protein
MPPNSVYVGRPTKWGNPFKIGDRSWGGTISFIPIYQPNADAVLSAYKDYLVNKCSWIIEEARIELRGKDLVCWCKEPKPGESDLCHADILLELANQ